jgi:alkaline phosphatase D
MPAADPFTHGVASGDPQPARVLLWARARPGNGGPVDLRWQVARDRGLAQVVASGEATAEAEGDHVVIVDAEGLEPGTTYFFGFEAGGSRSPVGRTRTLPAGRVDRVRFAVFSCAKYSAGYFNALGRIADRDDLDFVLCLGDYIYEYSNRDKGLGPDIDRPMDPDHRCLRLEDYRTRYAQARGDRDLQRMHLRHPVIALPDDHEMADNAWRGGAKKHDPRRHGDWGARKAAALRAWREWLPARLPPDEPTRLYRSFSLGDLADLILADTRTRRDRQAHAPESEDPDRTLLGSDQRGWLTDRLAGSTAAWRLLANQVMVAQVKSDLLPDEVDRPLSEISMLDQSDGGPQPDHWDGYPAERRRLLEAIRDRGIADVAAIAGDAHSSWACDLKLDPHDPEDRAVAVEFTTPSATSENLDDEAGWAYRTKSVEVERRIIRENPHIHWAELDSHGYLVVDVTPDRVRGEWHFVDTVHRPSTGERLAARFEVRRGEARLRRA